MIVRFYAALAAVCFVTIASCTKQEISPETPIVIEKSNLKEILSFSFKSADSVEVPADQLTVNFRNDTFFLTFPYVTDLNILVPTIAIRGMAISPDSSVTQDFSQPVRYTVTARDSTTKTFVVVSANKSFRALYFGSSNGHLYALNPDNANVIWDNDWLGTFTYSGPVSYGKSITPVREVQCLQLIR
jgi:hypothetical protein